MGNTNAKPSNLPSFSDLKSDNSTNKKECNSNGLSETQGVTFKCSKSVSSVFQASNSISFQCPNPYYGLKPNAPECETKFAHSAHLLRNVENNEPKTIILYDINSDLNINLRHISNHGPYKLSVASGMDTSGASLIREATVEGKFEKYCHSTTFAPQSLLTKDGPTFQGVVVSSLLYQASEKLRLGGELKFVRMQRPMAGLATSLSTCFGGQYCWKPSTILRKEAGYRSAIMEAKPETSFVIDCRENSIIPSKLELSHYVSGGMDANKNGLFADFSIEKDPLPPQMGGTGKLVSRGSIGVCTKLPNPEAKKKSRVQTAEDMYPFFDGTVITTSLNTKFDLQMSIKTSMKPLPAEIGLTWNYNTKEDKFKMGAGIQLIN